MSSNQIHILVEYEDGLPNFTLGVWQTQKTRSFQAKGAAENYRQQLLDQAEFHNEQRKRRDQDLLPLPDIRILTVSAPVFAFVPGSMYPAVLPVASAVLG